MDLIPNKSYGYFILNENIDHYLNHPHIKESINERLYSYDSYNFFEDDIIVWTEHNRIDTIRCEKQCFWKDKNLIGITIDEFIFLFKVKPDEQDFIYVCNSHSKGQNQKVYTFIELGLQVWVWRKKIVTILISNYGDS